MDTSAGSIEAVTTQLASITVVDDLDRDLRTASGDEVLSFT